MKTYIGTKIIQARPMSRVDYNAYRNWVLPDNEEGADAGYLVEYLDGGKANDSRHAGYISWSPQAQFDAAYVQVDTNPGLPPHMQRVAAEQAELDDRRGKLNGFLGSEIFARLPKDEQSRLWRQAEIMDDYSNILRDRLVATQATAPAAA